MPNGHRSSSESYSLQHGGERPAAGHHAGTRYSIGAYKAPDLTGPIDDAFTSAFLCVRGTGKPWHNATHRYAEDNLERYEARLADR